MTTFSKISSKILAKVCKALALYGLMILVLQILFYYVAYLLAFAAHIELNKNISPSSFGTNLIFSIFLLVTCSYLYFLGDKWEKQ